MHTRPPETIGQRIARLRVQRGLTQQALAARLAISRVAVSHIEMDLSVPSERTIALLAGVFKLSPHELVEGATYPPAKAERLPAVVARYTEVEQAAALLANDLAWLERLATAAETRRLAAELRRTLRREWQGRLEQLAAGPLDEDERELLRSVLENWRRFSV